MKSEEIMKATSSRSAGVKIPFGTKSMPQNIYLIGMMGSGKTETGRCLAVLLGAAFLDLDLEIEKKAGMTIPGIFSAFGESRFRELESEALQEASRLDRCVISTGGGIVCRAANTDLLRRTGRVIFLEANPDVLFERVKGDLGRPLLQTADPREKIKTLLNDRMPDYRKTAHRSVPTDGKSPEEVAGEIFKSLEDDREIH